MRTLLVAAMLCACGHEDVAPDFDAPPPGRPDATPWNPPDAAPPPACANGIDDDDDDRMDWPYEPGCADPDDDDETDPVPLPECSDGIDNDGYYGTDWPMDVGCLSAGDDDENALPPAGDCGPSVLAKPIDVPGTASGAITAGPNDLGGSCGGLGNEAAYRFNVLEPTPSLTITAVFEATVVDLVMYVRVDCDNPATELACTDSPETIVLTDVAPGSYSLILDSYGPGSLGAYELAILEE